MRQFWAKLRVYVIAMFLLVLIAPCIFIVSMVERNFAAPHSGITVEEFASKRTPLRIYELDSKILWLGESGFTGSGPSIYFFDENGVLQDWQFSSGEGGALDEAWSRFKSLGEEMSIQGLEKAKKTKR